MPKNVAGAGKCNACGKKFKAREYLAFFMSSDHVPLHKGFLCVKCANEYEEKYLK